MGTSRKSTAQVSAANSRISSSSSSATMATFAPTLTKSELIHGCSPQLLTTRLPEPSFWKPLQESRPHRHQSHNLLQALNRSRSKSRDPQRWSERFSSPNQHNNTIEVGSAAVP